MPCKRLLAGVAREEISWDAILSSVIFVGIGVVAVHVSLLCLSLIAVRVCFAPDGLLVSLDMPARRPVLIEELR